MARDGGAPIDARGRRREVTGAWVYAPRRHMRRAEAASHSKRRCKSSREMRSASHAVRAIALASRRRPSSAACPKTPSCGSGLEMARRLRDTKDSLFALKEEVGAAPVQSALDKSVSVLGVRRLVGWCAWPWACVLAPLYTSISPESRK